MYAGRFADSSRTSSRATVRFPGSAVHCPQVRLYWLQAQVHALGHKADMRDYGIGLQILKHLGLRQVRLLTNNPKKTEAFNLRSFDVEVVDQVPIVTPSNPHNAEYLATKRDKMGHQLPESL